MNKYTVTTAMAFLMICSSAYAQQAAERYICNVKDTNTKENLRLEFIFDRPRDKALMVGNNGTADVAAIPGAKILSFLELLPSGVVQTTSIDQLGNAVHSRHTHSSSEGNFIQSQWTGRCPRT